MSLFSIPVFVYGTLKKDYPLNYVLKNSEFVGRMETVPKFSLYELGSFPGLKDHGNTAVKGELYFVDEDTLQQLDFVEGVPHLYKRKKIKLKDYEEEVWSYIYAKPTMHLRTIGNEWI